MGLSVIVEIQFHAQLYVRLILIVKCLAGHSAWLFPLIRGFQNKAKRKPAMR